MSERCDIVVVGSRLAGASAAVHFARAGQEVVVLDRSAFPSDQLSTHLLFPAGVHELDRMGALGGILASDPTLSPWIQVEAGGEVHKRERWRASGPIDYCLCVPRTVQDLELVRAARAAGAQVREKCQTREVLWRGGRACGVRYTDRDGVEHDIYAKLVVGADGRRSTVAGAVGVFKPYRSSRNGRGLAFRYGTDPLADTVAGQTIYQWWDDGALAFLFPSQPRGRMLMLFMGAAEEVNEAKADREGYWQRKLQMHPSMARRVAGTTDLTGLRLSNDTSSYFRASSGPGWVLIGDAGHFKDPVIGQGQRDALWSGRVLAESVSEVLDDPAGLDLAVRRFEADRDRECLPSYHFGNIETEPEPVSPVLVEMLRASGGSTAPLFGDLFNRSRTMTQVMSLPRLTCGLVEAMRRGTLNPAHGRGPANGPVEELRIQLRVRAENLRRAFRSARVIEGSERPAPQPPIFRAGRAAGSGRSESTGARAADGERAVAATEAIRTNSEVSS